MKIGEVEGIFFSGKAREYEDYIKSFIAIYGKDCPVWFVLAEIKNRC